MEKKKNAFETKGNAETSDATEVISKTEPFLTKKKGVAST
jgi:hypothetical protein